MTHDSNPEFIGGTNPGPNSAIDAYFFDIARPGEGRMEEAGKIIGAPHREFEATQDNLSICEDLAKDIPEVTTVLAAMISVGHEALPQRWRSDPEETKMVLSMVGHLEIGYIRAQQAAIRRGPGFPGLPEREAAIERLLTNLQGDAVTS